MTPKKLVEAPERETEECEEVDDFEMCKTSRSSRKRTSNKKG
jgi:hypothetical protein